MSGAGLRLRGFGVALDGRVVLAHVDLEVPPHGRVVIVGPGGAGKSTLLRTLAGLNDAHPAIGTWGEATLDGRPLAERRGRVGLVVQHSRFFLDTVRENLVSALPNRSTLDRAAQDELALGLLERAGLRYLAGHLASAVVELPKATQRLLAIARASADDPAVLLADEPTAGLDDADAAEVLALLRTLSSWCAVVVVTHNQRHAKALGGTTALLAGGRVVTRAPTAVFFRTPPDAHARRFVETGGCDVPSPDATEEELDELTPRPAPLPSAAQRVIARKRSSPHGFFWVIPEELGGMPRPGIVADLEPDLLGLASLGIGVLVTLEEAPSADASHLEALGIRSVHFPIPDMGAPSVEDASAICAEVTTLLAAGTRVAFHCRAGLGRTGTMLAAVLVWRGESAIRAIDRVRRINPGCIQSDAQVAFLGAFEAATRRTPEDSLPNPIQEPRRTSNVA